MLTAAHAALRPSGGEVMPAMIGNVTQARYEQIVTEWRELMREHTRIQFRMGEWALDLFTDRRSR
ncbi:hypothetical protein [Couchioplanes caeruleus]|uniref:Uncharacterized protein n=2 Tax=Couchioplanes caeruleus TaxID=56438 RepID=A0A1K0FQP5_9ACTN|nr:hypothetical protein [Couchioplanes caeruleus]OJF15149.1 hypothetical protein BG844_06090 [Couchioplanes caeruleus subsp. caeruleus]